MKRMRTLLPLLVVALLAATMAQLSVARDGGGLDPECQAVVEAIHNTQAALEHCSSETDSLGISECGVLRAELEQLYQEARIFCRFYQVP